MCKFGPKRSAYCAGSGSESVPEFEPLEHLPLSLDIPAASHYCIFNLGMVFAPTLPAELWLTILELVIEARITLVEQCDPISFPDIDAHLRSPKDHPLVDDAYHQLRLVCRNFHALLSNSPHFVMKSTESAIPTATRALYFTTSWRSEAFKQLLAAEPSNFLRISRLDIFCDFHKELGPSIFDVLCENSGALPNVGCLTLRIVYRRDFHPIIRFWGRLNDAFPLLACLILTLNKGITLPWYQTDLCISAFTESDVVTFQNLEVLDVGPMTLHYGIHFPSLRHIAGGRFRGGTEPLRRSPLLESVLIRRVTDGTRIDLSSLPMLRLVGIPMWEEHTIDPVDGVPPLEHVWIFAQPSTPPQYMEHAICRIPARLPGVSRITIDLSLIDRADGVELRRILENMGLQSIGLLVRGDSGDGSRIVIERTWMYDPPRFVTKPGEKRGILKGILRKIRL